MEEGKQDKVTEREDEREREKGEREGGSKVPAQRGGVCVTVEEVAV